jgi:dienelactone hydrolase
MPSRNHLKPVALLAAALVAGCGGHSTGERRVSLTVQPASGLADAPVAIDVRGLRAHGRATLRARWSAFGGHEWTSSMPLRATAAGAVTLRGVDGTRFLWGMSPVGQPWKHPFFSPPASGPSGVALSVTVDGRTVARATLSRRVTPPSVRVRELTTRRDGIDGVLFTPRVHTRRPAAVVFGGSEGGNTMVDVAGLLAAHGYPALSLAYFGQPGLPSQLVRIPLEYFARAVRVLRRAPEVDPAHVVVMGTSRGGEAALLLASTFPRLIHGAIGLVPSDSVYPAPAANLRAWTLHGRAVPLEQIPVERISGPVLTAGAGDDRVWSSKESVAQIEHRLTAHHFRFAHRGLTYERAGHLVGTALPYQPTSTQQAGFGGTPRSDAIAKADLWPRILRFIAGPGS